MSTIFNGLRELMWCTTNVKKSDILNNDENFLINKANDLIENESFRLFSTNIDYEVDIDGTSLKVDFKKEEPKLETKTDEMRIDVYEILENSSVYSPDLIKPENLELKIETKQDTSIYGYGHEVFNDSEFKFYQNIYCFLSKFIRNIDFTESITKTTIDYLNGSFFKCSLTYRAI